MKKCIIIVFLCIALISCIVLAARGENSKDDNLMRLHIRANSNSAADQSVKLNVRDVIVDLLESRLSNIKTVGAAKKAVESMLKEIENAANSVLKSQGKNYLCKARVSNEFFPARMYDDFLVESGYYDALILELGSGQGDNWWCVIYPPLCYVEVNYGGSFKYKSKIKEIIDKYFKITFA